MTHTAEGTPEPSQPAAAPEAPASPPAAASNPAPTLPRLTFSMIVETLKEPRLSVATQASEGMMGAAARTHKLERTRLAAIALLAVLTADELREIAASLRVPADGPFIEVYRRLVHLC